MVQQILLRGSWTFLKQRAGKTEEADLSHMFTSEQTQHVLLLTRMASIKGRHGAELSWAVLMTELPFSLRCFQVLLVILPAARSPDARKAGVPPPCLCYCSALVSKATHAQKDQEYGCWERDFSVTWSYVSPQVRSRWTLGTKQDLKAGRVKGFAFFFSFLQTTFFHVRLHAANAGRILPRITGLWPSKQGDAHTRRVVSLELAQCSCCQLQVAQRKVSLDHLRGHGVGSSRLLNAFLGGRRNSVALGLPTSRALEYFLWWVSVDNDS